MAEVAVVGAGVGGLSAAIDLSRRGHAVTVYEAGAEVGGKIGRVLIDGVEADTGPSVLTMPEVFDELFRAAGSSLEDEVELVTHDALADLRWPDGCRLVLHHAPEASHASIAATLGSDAADQFAAFLRYAASIWEEAAPAFVLGDAPTFGTAITLGLRNLRALHRIDPMRTMLAAIHHHVTEPHLRDLLARYATYNGSDPREAPATLNCIAHVELSLGCFGVRGGMYELARAMERVARRHAVAFQLSMPVRVIRREGDRFAIVTDATTATYDSVIANADAAHVFGSLIDNPAHTAAPPSMSGWTALVRTPRRERLAHGVLFPQRYLTEFEHIFDDQRAPADPTVYVCAQEVAHQRSGGRDHELLFCMANAPATAEGTTDEDQLRDAVIHKLRAAEWIVDEEIVWERGPHDLAAQYPGTHGAIYGGSSNSRFAAFRRPANRVASIPGLYLASGSAHPGGGVPLCALSGRAAARALHDDITRR